MMSPLTKLALQQLFGNGFKNNEEKMVSRMHNLSDEVWEGLPEEVKLWHNFVVDKMNRRQHVKGVGADPFAGLQMQEIPME